MANTKDIQSAKRFIDEKHDNFSGGYKNIPIFSAPFVHEKCFEVFSSLNLNKDINILIVGAGGGAFDQRLIDNGYKNITAIEFIKENYKADNQELFDYDLNEDFHLNFQDKKFDMVIAIEIIEHLYSPYDFLRKIKSLLKNDGYIIVSSPNPENSISRIKFLLARNLHFFGPLDLKLMGHMSPIFSHIFDYYISSLGYKLILKTKNRNIFEALSFKLKVIYIIFYIFILYKKDESQINIYLLQKSIQ